MKVWTSEEDRVSVSLSRASDNQVQTPLAISEKEANDVLKAAEIMLNVVRYFVEKCPQSIKERFRQYFNELPKEVWETGEIPIEWPREKE